MKTVILTIISFLLAMAIIISKQQQKQLEDIKIEIQNIRIPMLDSIPQNNAMEHFRSLV